MWYWKILSRKARNQIDKQEKPHDVICCRYSVSELMLLAPLVDVNYIVHEKRAATNLN